MSDPVLIVLLALEAVFGLFLLWRAGLLKSRGAWVVSLLLTALAFALRALVFDFPDDREALRQDCEYMFGHDYLVCPVTQPGVSKWKVYLPENQAGWEDFRDGTHYDGGQYVCVPVNLEMIPVFKRL